MAPGSTASGFNALVRINWYNCYRTNQLRFKMMAPALEVCSWYITKRPKLLNADAATISMQVADYNALETIDKTAFAPRNCGSA